MRKDKGHVDKHLYDGDGTFVDDPSDYINGDQGIGEDQLSHIQFAQSALATDGIMRERVDESQHQLNATHIFSGRTNNYDVIPKVEPLTVTLSTAEGDTVPFNNTWMMYGR